MILKQKIKAGALALVLVVSMIILSLLGMMVLLQQQGREYLRRQHAALLLERNAHSGLVWLCADNAIAYGEILSLDLFGDEKDSITLAKSPWGVFELGIVQSFRRRDTLSMAGLLGAPLLDQERYALFLSNEDRPLSLSGETFIRGDAFLPPAGIRKSYIEGKQYAGDEVPVRGTISDSGPAMPTMNHNLLQAIRSFFSEPQETSIHAFPPARDSIIRSFLEPTLHLHFAQETTLSGEHLTGNIILSCDSALRIKADNVFSDVLIFAPSIFVEEGFRGTIQLFALDSIHIGADCRLAYPSSVGLLNRPASGTAIEFSPYIRIDSASRVHGAVFAESRESDFFMSVIQVGPDALVTGTVHAAGLLELRGTVLGSTRCRRFKLQTSSTLYENFVLDATMDFTSLSTHFGWTPLLTGNGRRVIAKWLH